MLPWSRRRRAREILAAFGTASSELTGVRAGFRLDTKSLSAVYDQPIRRQFFTAGQTSELARRYAEAPPE